MLLHLDIVPSVVALLAPGHHVNVLAEEVHQLPLSIWPPAPLSRTCQDIRNSLGPFVRAKGDKDPQDLTDIRYPRHLQAKKWFGHSLHGYNWWGVETAEKLKLLIRPYDDAPNVNSRYAVSNSSSTPVPTSNHQPSTKCPSEENVLPYQAPQSGTLLSPSWSRQKSELRSQRSSIFPFSDSTETKRIMSGWSWQLPPENPAGFVINQDEVF